jgi:hypothetical protein
MTKWMPIETAPQDGTAIWLLVDGRPYLGYGEPEHPVFERPAQWVVKATFRRIEDGNDEIVGCYSHGEKPTAWQPLPSPPESV